MIRFTGSKVNLGLTLVRKRSDGYHDIETIFYPVPLFDAVEVLKADVLSFHAYGLAIPGNSEDNLCLKAYHLLAKDFDLSPVKIVLLKKTPMGAGLGGGSSNAAGVLNLLNDLFELQIPLEKLQIYASQLGSDCTFFIRNKPCFAHGRGTEMEPISLSLSSYDIKIVTPDIHVSTALAYQGCVSRGTSLHLKEHIQEPIETWKDTIVNDFEQTVFKAYPEIAKIKQSFYDQGAVYASMSGSGSSVFGLFEKDSILKKS